MGKPLLTPAEMAAVSDQSAVVSVQAVMAAVAAEDATQPKAALEARPDQTCEESALSALANALVSHVRMHAQMDA